jgi:hypothetical protein
MQFSIEEKEKFMNKTEASTVLGALESIVELLDLVLRVRTLPQSPDVLTAKAEDAIRIMRAELRRTDSEPELPQGWRLVPLEPTARMISRGHHRIDFDRSNQSTFDPYDESQRGGLNTGSTCAEDLREAYQAMLEAAPKLHLHDLACPGMLGAHPRDSTLELRSH